MADHLVVALLQMEGNLVVLLQMAGSLAVALRQMEGAGIQVAALHQNELAVGFVLK
jgi:hypothetical protein